jgi:hypothetical protein
MGPKFSSLSGFVFTVGSALSVNLEEIIEMKEGVFWIILMTVQINCILWVLMAVVIIWKFDLRFENSDFCVNFGMAAETALPIIGNAGFIPIIAILLDVFLCTESIGDSYTDSFMDRDCHVWCWEGEHISYSVFALICLLVYSPFAIYARPWWQFY